MKAALISLGSVSSQWTADAMKKHFESVDTLNLNRIEVSIGKEIEILYVGKPLPSYDCIYAKGSFRYAAILTAITSIWYKNAYMPLKPRSFDIGHDKFLTQIALNQRKVPMPTTYIFPSLEAARKILEKVNYPIIMKFPQGTQGRGVMFADSYASASSILDALASLKQPLLIQEYIDTQGTDIRAIVVGERVVAAMKRTAVKGEERANIHAGGSGKPAQLDTYTKNIAVEAAKAAGAEICGVDILESNKGPLVIEVNISPGLQGITATTKIDVASEIAKYLAARTSDIKESGRKSGTSRILDDLGIEKTATSQAEKQIIMNLDFRAERILLPKVVTGITRFAEKDDIIIRAEKGKLTVEKA